MIRDTTPDDHAAVLDLVGRAFNGGDEEVGIVETTWKLGAAHHHLDLVATEADEIVGYVVAADGQLGSDHTAAGIAPLAVDPAQQNQGIGSALMIELLRRAGDEQQLPLLVLLGNPAYYGRFGFEPAHRYGISYAPAGADSPYFQVRRLAPYDPSYRGEYTYCWER